MVIRPQQLPAILPVFPLPGVLLLPRASLPLHIFEPRYLAMVRAVLASDQRLLVMAQPRLDPQQAELGSSVDLGALPLFSVGCAGRITRFEETDDGRFFITLKGVVRLKIGAEQPLCDGYRQIACQWDNYLDDLVEPQDAVRPEDHRQLLDCLLDYANRQQLALDAASLADVEAGRLVDMVALLCPFDPLEKQALLEAPSLAERAKICITLLEMAAKAAVFTKGNG